MKNRHDAGTTETPEQIIEHISRLMAEAEAMLAGPVTEQVGGQLSDLKDRLSDAKGKVSDMYARARSNVIAGAKFTDETIREYPYYAMAAALGFGLLVGVLLRRGTRD